MSATYTTRSGDTADSICWDYYGTSSTAVVLQLLEANPGLADQGLTLPEGLRVILPKMATTTTKTTRLWD